MKKILILVLTVFVFISCYKNKSDENVSSGTQSSTTTDKERTVVIDSIRCTYVYGNGHYARIITSKMMPDTAFLSKAIRELNVTENPIYFHIPDLTGSGEEYASLAGYNLFVYNDAPKTRADAEANKLISKMDGNIADLELLNMSKNLEFDGIAGYLDIIYQAALAYNNNKDSENKRVKEQSKKLLSKLKATQTVIFPKLRKLFADESKNRLWVEDITVTHSGKTISFTGYVYASNKNIRDSYQAMSSILYKLRFTRANFRWSSSAGYTYYTIDSKADGYVEEY